MVNIRQAISQDAEIIGHQRVRMFADAGIADEQQTASMLRTFVPWVLAKLEDGSYIGWLAEREGTIVGGAGLWLMEFPPNWMDEQPLRAYLLNFFVIPEMRRQGLARKLLNLSLQEARARGVNVVTLAASKYGRPLYEQYGFKPTNEMILRLHEK
jgi:GNAT superfamily N-acetyltransferase